MRILVLGGTGFVGQAVVSQLRDAGHSIMVFHRGTVPVPPGVWPITGDRHDLDACRHRLRCTWPDVVIDLIAASGRQAAALMRVFRGVAGRLVVASSIDVYRACAVLHGLDDGPMEPTPLTESSALRSGTVTYSPEQLHRLMGVFGWLDERYDKIAVERVVSGDPDLPATILRLPMIYGPGDRLHRLRPLVRRMDNNRPAILLSKPMAEWRAPRGYLDNVAAALVLAATREEAAGRTYNVAEEEGLTELEWARSVARAAAWPGRFVVLPPERMPAHLRDHGNLAQHWDADASRIRRELGYVEPVTRDEAIRRTVAWERHIPLVADDLEALDYAAEDAALADALRLTSRSDGRSD